MGVKQIISNVIEYIQPVVLAKGKLGDLREEYATIVE
jgi:hypothetical protein